MFNHLKIHYDSMLTNVENIDIGGNIVTNFFGWEVR